MIEKDIAQLRDHPRIRELFYVMTNAEKVKALIFQEEDPETGRPCVYITPEERGLGRFKFVLQDEGYLMIHTPDRPGS